jgi:glyoxylase-like metal-dependent hydrolase (beta-lactamase superfamily II)
MASVPFTKGLHDLGNGHHAYLQPSGTWGYSNAGLIIDGDQSLLVDTLFDERLTAEMLVTMQAATSLGADDITTLINTHANGDHTFGNHLVRNARIIASALSAHEMAHEGSPQLLASIMARTGEMGELGKYFDAIFGPFDFAGVHMRLPDETFSGAKTIHVGNKRVDFIEVGPAHTAGDTLVYVPDDKILYSGDILFVKGTPILWAGPVRNWLSACDRILSMEIEAIVPGHGPITDKDGVRAMHAYFTFVEAETRKRHAAGMDSWEAAQDIALAEFGAWEDPERIAVTVDTIFREITADESPRDIMELFGRMAKLDQRYTPQRTQAHEHGACAHEHH